MKNSKMKEFEEKAVKDIATLNQTEMGVVEGGGISVSLNWPGWGNGNFWGHMFDGVRGNMEVDEFD
jgi:hypothetical protein